MKSDDVNGRTKVYKNIVDGNHRMEAGMPESFNVLGQGNPILGINIELESDGERNATIETRGEGDPPPARVAAPALSSWGDDERA